MGMKLEDIQDDNLKKKIKQAIRKEDVAKSGGASDFPDLELGDRDTPSGNKSKPKTGNSVLAKSKKGVQGPFIQVPVIVCITFFRKRLPDFDGCIIKWILDSLVETNVLQDDSQKFVKKVEKEYVKVTTEAEEKTVIELYEDETASYQKELGL